VTGVQQIAPVAAMFVFAILYFGIITDAGTLEPVINAILGAVGARPTRVVVGSALLALLVHLDGSGRSPFWSPSRPCCPSTTASASIAAFWRVSCRWPQE
jgi:Mg2+/citrate symporter